MSENHLVEQQGAGVCAGPRPVVHLELHTRDLSAAGDFYARLLRWRTERIATDHGPYLALELGGQLGGGVVQCGTPHPVWIPYVAIDRIDLATERARALGASVLFGPREGPTGWRSVITAPDGGQLALWQQKEWR